MPKIFSQAGGSAGFSQVQIIDSSNAIVNTFGGGGFAGPSSTQTAFQKFRHNTTNTSVSPTIPAGKTGFVTDIIIRNRAANEPQLTFLDDTAGSTIMRTFLGKFSSGNQMDTQDHSQYHFNTPLQIAAGAALNLQCASNVDITVVGWFE